MQDERETSNLVGILKTAGFFIVVIGFVAGIIYLTTAPASDSPQAGDYKTLDISTLSDYEYKTPNTEKITSPDYQPNSQIPEEVMRLHGQKVAITGFMMPVRVDEDGSVQEFALNGNYDMCFYGAPSQINQWVHVKMLPGAKAQFSHNPTTIEGTLEVGELIEDGEIISVYRLNGHRTAAKKKRY